MKKLNKDNKNINLEVLTKEEQDLLLQMTLQILTEAGEPLTYNQIKERVEKLIDEFPIEQ